MGNVNKVYFQVFHAVRFKWPNYIYLAGRVIFMLCFASWMSEYEIVGSTLLNRRSFLMETSNLLDPRTVRGASVYTASTTELQLKGFRRAGLTKHQPLINC